MQDTEQGSGIKELQVISACSNAEEEVARLAWYFFKATTRLSSDNEDILPQEDSEDMKLSVFTTFADLFSDVVGENGAGAKNKRMRLHFNKVGYQIYGKEQSRRVPAVRAKPGNPGYGFRRARWRDTEADKEDRAHCQKVPFLPFFQFASDLNVRFSKKLVVTPRRSKKSASECRRFVVSGIQSGGLLAPQDLEGPGDQKMWQWLCRRSKCMQKCLSPGLGCS